MKTIPRTLAILATLATVVAVGPTTALAVPPGNNGTVKMDGRTLDDAPDNEPHLPCQFQIDFYGYDQGDLDAEWILNLHPPTGTAHLLSGTVPIGEDAAGGGTDLDASVNVSLGQALRDSGAEPHPIQGYHVKLTVHAEGSIGADIKYKVFWASCES
jgi:hypothetical protein